MKNEKQRMQNSTAWRRYLMILIFSMLILSGLISATQFSVYAGQKNNDQNTQITPAGTEATGAEKLTVWEIIEMNDWLLWPFILLTAIGIMLICYRALYEYRDQNRSKGILLRSLQMNDLRNLEQLTRNEIGCRAGRLIQLMFATFRKTRQAGPLGNDVSQFLGAERQLFETFQRVLGYLSDSAGALGLLGTVWGIFVTFHSGQLDGPAILRGMSVALITTLTGLIISLLLNLGVTGVFSTFNNQLNLLGTRAEELRQLFLVIESKKPSAEAPAEKPVSPRVNEPEYEVPYPEPRMMQEKSRPPVRKAQPEPMLNSADFMF